MTASPRLKTMTTMLLTLATGTASADVQQFSLASGFRQGRNPRDASVHAITASPLYIGSIPDSDFVAAQSGAMAYLTSTPAPGWGVPPGVSHWITSTSTGTTAGLSAIYAVAFTVQPDALTDRWTGTLDLQWSADYTLGGGALAGAYVNGVPLAGSVGGGPGSISSATLPVPVGTIRTGVNWLYLFVPGPSPATLPHPSGLAFTARVTARPLSAGPAPAGGFPSIGEAVAAAADGDVIPVLPGVYAENLAISGKSIGLRAIAGPEQTLIRNLDTTQPPLMVYGPGGFDRTPGGGVLIDGFTITHTNSDAWGTIYVEGCEAVFRNCRILPHVRCAALEVWADALGDTSLRLENCLIKQFLGSAVTPIFVGSASARDRHRADVWLSGCTLVGSGVTGGPASPAALLRASSWDAIGSGTIMQVEGSIFRGFSGGTFVTQTSGATPGNARVQVLVRNSNLPGGGPAAVGLAPTAWSGRGNIDADPLFVDAVAGDYRLLAGSPCIDAGLDTLASGLTDIGGQPRRSGPRVDMGAFEFQSGACGVDFNHDGEINPDDLGDFITAFFGGCP